MAAQITEVTEGIYEIKPEGTCTERFPLCTTYLVVDDKTALVEVGLPSQAAEIAEAVKKLIGDAGQVSYILFTHIHADHAGGIGLMARHLPQAEVVAYPEAAKFFIDESSFATLIDRYKMVFGQDAEEKHGQVLMAPEERFLLIRDGENINLGKRALRAVLTPGHDPHHLCFLDTLSGGLFCGDAIGTYNAEIDLVIPSYSFGTHFTKAWDSIQKLRELEPSMLFFSHGCAVTEGNRYMEMAADNFEACQKIALEGLRAHQPKEDIAARLLDFLAEGSEAIRAELDLSWDITLNGIAAYLYFFKKKNMI